MDAQMSRVLGELAHWRGSRVAVEVEWFPGGDRLVHQAGPLGEVAIQEGPDRWGDARVLATVPIGDGFQLVVDSSALVDAEHRAAEMALQLGDSLRVILNRVGTAPA